MTRVFDHLLADHVIPASSVPAFERYLADPVFADQVEGRLLMQARRFSAKRRRHVVTVTRMMPRSKVG